MQRIKKDDRVKVITGKDRGTTGRVVRVWPSDGRVMVEGVNVQTKHTPIQRSRTGTTEGGIVHEEAPLPASNVLPICEECGEATRVGAKFVDGVKHRNCRACDATF
ncbi:50S ribosomal protein L24 [Egibacter rhizosphaerae]|uniref:Large ribosomal subunit protein uL24 n=2 Tax=Egibacter rhizosphaerae TaxID=1670831 RepID=A0A411YLG2_9ACTN|nr:50S ribosomal protein L24 [Egibacter rhizosphaerae]QBI22032.1 50S ribosomal protein L24 [Egibacter rhizosphaerae]